MTDGSPSVAIASVQMAAGFEPFHDQCETESFGLFNGLVPLG
jgi:hypothetical protein